MSKMYCHLQYFKKLYVQQKGCMSKLANIAIILKSRMSIIKENLHCLSFPGQIKSGEGVVFLLFVSRFVCMYLNVALLCF